MLELIPKKTNDFKINKKLINKQQQIDNKDKVLDLINHTEKIAE